MNYLTNFTNYSKSSGHSGSSQKSHAVRASPTDAVATPLNRFANSSNIIIPPLLLKLFKSI